MPRVLLTDAEKKEKVRLKNLINRTKNIYVIHKKNIIMLTKRLLGKNKNYIIKRNELILIRKKNNQLLKWKHRKRRRGLNL